jgi:hypothetical protein
VLNFHLVPRIRSWQPGVNAAFRYRRDLAATSAPVAPLGLHLSAPIRRLWLPHLPFCFQFRFIHLLLSLFCLIFHNVCCLRLPASVVLTHLSVLFLVRSCLLLRAPACFGRSLHAALLFCTTYVFSLASLALFVWICAFTNIQIFNTPAAQAAASPPFPPCNVFRGQQTIEFERFGWLK